VLFSQNKSATSNQPAVLFFQNKSAPAISHQPTEQAARQNFFSLYPLFLTPHQNIDMAYYNENETPKILPLFSSCDVCIYPKYIN
jgi:hypothetical protein